MNPDKPSVGEMPPRAPQRVAGGEPARPPRAPQPVGLREAAKPPRAPQPVAAGAVPGPEIPLGDLPIKKSKVPLIISAVILISATFSYWGYQLSQEKHEFASGGAEALTTTAQVVDKSVMPAVPVVTEVPKPAAPVVAEAPKPATPVVDQPVMPTASVVTAALTTTAPVVDKPVMPVVPVVSEAPKPAAPVVDQSVMPAAPVVAEALQPADKEPRGLLSRLFHKTPTTSPTGAAPTGKSSQQPAKEGAKKSSFQDLIVLAEKGDVQAQSQLGHMYATGQGTAKNYSKALEWNLKAAKSGSARAQSNLGVAYGNGQGVKSDAVEAYAWWYLAAKNGSSAARSNMKLFDKVLSETRKLQAIERSKSLTR
jgi:Sel1 repeat